LGFHFINYIEGCNEGQGVTVGHVVLVFNVVDIIGLINFVFQYFNFLEVRVYTDEVKPGMINTKLM